MTKVTVHITLTEDLVETLKKLKGGHMTRSTFVEEMILAGLRAREINYHCPKCKCYLG